MLCSVRYCLAWHITKFTPFPSLIVVCWCRLTSSAVKIHETWSCSPSQLKRSAKYLYHELDTQIVFRVEQYSPIYIAYNLPFPPLPPVTRCIPSPSTSTPTTQQHSMQFHPRWYSALLANDEEKETTTAHHDRWPFNTTRSITQSPPQQQHLGPKQRKKKVSQCSVHHPASRKRHHHAKQEVKKRQSVDSACNSTIRLSDSPS